MASIGDAYIDVHANTAPFDRELDRGLERIADSSEKELDRTGTRFGDKIVKSTSKEIGRRGKDIGRSIEGATKNVVVRVRSIFRFDKIRDSIRRRMGRDVGDSIAEDIGEALTRSTRDGGIFSKFGQGIADAIGAGFNVSGRSPLIALLLPALAALVGVILAAVQAANALVAVLFIIPGLLASIALQVGVLMIAFQGIGTAVQGAFAAKNAQELNEAIKNLSPSAQSFVKELLPLKGFFQDLQQQVQESFFAPLLGAITQLRQALGPSLVKGFSSTAEALGKFFASFAGLLASPSFVKFFNTLVPATVRWIDKLGGSLFGKRGFINALLAMATALMPFMEAFGDILLRNLDQLSNLMFQLASSPATQKWLDDMAATLQLVFDLLFKVGEFLFVFLAQLNNAGGAELFTVLMEALDRIMFILASPVGLKAMEGLINLGIIGIKTFAGLVIAVLLVLAAFQGLAEWLKDVFLPGWGHTLQNIGGAIVAAATFVGVWIQRILGAIANLFVGMKNVVAGARNNTIRWVSEIIAKISEWAKRIRGIPGVVAGAFKNFGNMLVNSGRALIQGLINGIQSKIQALLNLLNWVANAIGNVLPGSPAKYGPLSGQGYVLLRGQRMMQDFIRGIQMEVPNLRQTTMNATSNIVFGRDSINMTFQGPVPDQTQARTVGTAVGMGAANMIAARNTRLAVRTL